MAGGLDVAVQDWAYLAVKITRAPPQAGCDGDPPYETINLLPTCAF